MANTRTSGYEKEQVAAEYLKKAGYQILEQNFYGRFGEIDLIAKDKEIYVFVEVKYRKNHACGSPLESVGYIKQKKICQTALYYLAKHRLGADTPCRFDVVAICGDEITHILNAFEFVG